MKALQVVIGWLAFSFIASACQLDGIQFSADFPAGRLNQCQQLESGAIELGFDPENRPINSSAWYAFTVAADKPQTIDVILTFDGDLPRYLPKISTDRVNWQNLPFDANVRGFEISLDVGKEPLWVAGQEILDNQSYAKWIGQLSDTIGKRGNIDIAELGKSTHGRPIQAITSKAVNSNEWIVLLGRQHPPEVTGALAMLPFVEKVLDNSPLSAKFRERFNLLIVPNLNPDGVAAGNWRHNINGKDLNRDWNVFSQVETQHVRDYLKALTERGEKLVFAVDFHSTQEDVFYTIPPDAGIYPSELAIEWLDSLKKDTNRFFKVRNKPGNSPGRGIFKQFVADVYKVHGVTFEVGDNTDRNLIKHIARVSAETFMQTLNSTNPNDFYPSREKSE